MKNSEDLDKTAPRDPDQNAPLLTEELSDLVMHCLLYY